MKYLILGGGPAGLTLGCCLKRMGEDSFVVLEAEATAGGLCRSADVDGAPLDIGGGHFLDVRRPEVTQLLFSYMPESKWNYFERDSRIRLGENILHHPFEANIWELPEDLQKVYLDSIAAAGCNNNIPIPEKFIDWIYWKLGDCIAENYMLPYNRKMFADNLNELGTYWLDKLPNVSYEDTLKSCREHKPSGKQPGHAQFYYPKKYGYGEVWLRMADSLGSHMEYNKKAVSLDFDSHMVRCSDGSSYDAQAIITTVPWSSFSSFENAPAGFSEAVAKLKHTSVEIGYHASDPDTTAHWIYEPDPSVPYHRLLIRQNFCPGSKGYWTEQRVAEPSGKPMHYFSEYAYPLNTREKPEALNFILQAAQERQILGLGRWGEHSHFNSDAVCERAMRLAEMLTGKTLL